MAECNSNEVLPAPEAVIDAEDCFCDDDDIPASIASSSDINDIETMIAASKRTMRDIIIDPQRWLDSTTAKSDVTGFIFFRGHW